LSILECRIKVSQGRKVILHDFDEINGILNSMADDGILEPMAEPIDCEDCHPMDWAEVTGLVDDLADNIYSEPTTMVDENGFVWYVS
jgi:hypothetical protein